MAGGVLHAQVGQLRFRRENIAFDFLNQLVVDDRRQGLVHLLRVDALHAHLQGVEDVLGHEHLVVQVLFDEILGEGVRNLHRQARVGAVGVDIAQARLRHGHDRDRFPQGIEALREIAGVREFEGGVGALKRGVAGDELVLGLEVRFIVPLEARSLLRDPLADPFDVEQGRSAEHRSGQEGVSRCSQEHHSGDDQRDPAPTGDDLHVLGEVDLDVLLGLDDVRHARRSSGGRRSRRWARAPCPSPSGPAG